MWHKFLDIIDWFGDFNERRKLVKSFNKNGELAFISGAAPTLLKARISMGERKYAHSFSKFLSSGFRIKALAGRPLVKQEMIDLGQVILSNEILVRKMLTLGWDTLEVHDDKGVNGVKWQLKNYANIGGYLGN